MRKVLKYLKPYRTAAILTVFLVLLHSLSQLILPSMMADIINEGITRGELSYIWRVGTIMLAISDVGVLVSILASACSSKASTGFGRELRRAVFYKVESLSQSDIDKIGTPSLITRSTNDIRQIQDMVLMVLRNVISAPLMMIGGVIMSFIMNKRLSMIIFLLLPIIVAIALVIVKKVMPMFDVMQKKTDRLNQVVREKLSGIRVIRAFNRSDYEDGRFGDANRELTGTALRINRMFAALIPVAMMLLYGTIITLVWVGSKQVDSFNPATQAAQIAGTVGNLQAFVLYLLMIIFALVMAVSLFIMVPRAAISARRIAEVLDLEPMILEPQVPKAAAKGESGHLVFEDVSFSYPGAQEPVLSHISFEARAGEVTAIIGGTGCGKSTLVNLIPRFYDVTGGRVLVDGVDVREQEQDMLHRKIGIVPQKAFLFSGTVADNLRYGKEDATQEEMLHTLEIAQARSFVEKLPNGLYDMVSQSGTNLSGGQKQRLAIARALIRPAEFYIFDDSFSALDFRTDARLRAAIRKYFNRANLIIVAQRVGTILDADRIIVLDEGKVAGIGTHRELLANCRVYQEIVESQLAKEEIV